MADGAADTVVQPVKTRSAWAERIQALRNVPPVLGILWESGRAVVTWGLILRGLVSGGPLLGAWIAKHIINGVEQAIRGRGTPAHFWNFVIAEVVVVVGTGIIARIITYCDSLLADRYTHYVSIRVMRQAAQLDLTTYENPEYYDRLERARVQATDRLAMIQMMGQLIQQVITTVLFSSVLLWNAPLLLLLLALAVIPSFLGETHFAFLGYAKNFRQTPAKREMDYLRQVGGSKEAAKELKLFNLSNYFTDRFSRLSEQIYKENIALSRSRLLWGGLFSIVGNGGYYGSYVYVIWRAIHGGYDIGTFAFITGAVQQAQTALQQVFSLASGIADQALFLTDLIGFFEMQPTVVSKQNGLKMPRPIRRGFEFRNVSFAYPGTTRRVLKDFNFHLRPGERIALIGENGQGKTTVVKLITRLYDPTEGEILLDGVDLREYALDDLHQEMGVIFQDFMRYEQMLGRRFESGVDLSGGEWQRIALARAYLRDAQLLILDEPTAALDARSELEVFERFAELTLGKMALLISHRFSTVRMADRIVVLAGGQLVEEGDHARLMALGGQYAEMFEMQAASYR